MRWLYLLFLAPGLIFGQTNDRRRVESQAFNKNESIAKKAKATWWRSGNFGLTPELSLSNLGYDSNIFSAETDEEDDLLVTPRAGIEAWYSSSTKWAWQNSAAYNYRYYADQERLREPEYSIDSILHGMFHKTYLEGGFTSRNGQGRQTSEQLQRVGSNRRNFFIKSIFQLTARSHLLADATVYSIRYDEPEGSSGSYNGLERDSRRLSAKYLHKVNPRFWPFVGVAQETFDFKEGGNPRQDAQFTGLLAGARNEKGERVHYSIELGSEDLSFDNAPQVEDTIITGKALMEYNLSRVSVITVGGLRGPLFSLSTDYAFFVSSRLSFDYTYRFARGVRMTSGVLLGNNSYDNPLEPVAVERSDDYRRFDVDLKFPLGGLFNVTVRTGFENRDSNLPNLSHDGFSILSDFSYKFQ